MIKNIKKIDKKVVKNKRLILIDLSDYNVPSIANVLLGYGIYMLFSSIDLGFESMVVTNAFKYLNRI